MTNPNEERITEAARLIAQRDHATRMLLRWQEKLDEANTSLTQMLGEAAVPETPEPAPVQ